MTDRLNWVTHPVVRTGAATALGYGVILALLTVLLFLIPYVMFLKL